MILKDSWIGIIQTPQITEAAPKINRCNTNIYEIYSGSGEYSPVANARFEISDFDIDSSSLTGVYSINVDMATYEDRELYFNSSDRLPNSWSRVETITISKTTSGLVGDNNLSSFILRNIPTHPNGFKHKFRLQFTNNKFTPAITNYSFPSTISGAMAANIFTTDLSYLFINDIHGFSFDLLDSNGKNILIEPAVAYKADDDDIYFCSNISYINGKNSSDVAFITPAQTNYIYSLGLDGLGEVFNGIDDMGEIAGVLDLQAEPMRDTWIGDTLSVVPISTDTIRLRWKNMWDHPTINNVTMANGTEATITNSQYKSGEYYVVYMGISDEDDRPTNLWPDRNDTTRKWYRVQELPVVNKNYSEYPLITTTIYGLPRGKYIVFYVGIMTRFTNSSSTNESQETNNLSYKHDMLSTMEITWQPVVS